MKLFVRFEYKEKLNKKLFQIWKVKNQLDAKGKKNLTENLIRITGESNENNLKNGQQRSKKYQRVSNRLKGQVKNI